VRVPLVLALAIAGCNVPVASALDESDANRIVMALDRASVDATKETDPTVEGKFRVTVARDDTPRALTLMRDEALPRPRSQGLLDAMDKGALVPGQATEHAQLVVGLAGELERSLEGVDGVLSARVHLNVPAPDPLRDGPLPKATASVLVEHRGSTPPIPSDAVQRLVAGGVAGLAPADVSVVLVSRPAVAVTAESQLVHVGPIAVARASALLLKVAMVVLVGLLMAFGASTLVFFGRWRRATQEAADAKV
jgi:type III secretion protein J